ncbi:ribosome biogenesis GTP-binding protein YihA/YsxC [Megamonas hypermegale]|uniref:ribosome biogenesis GTP-binding protein YihA/YsxC n=1 Tax=Megamonas hypermegale TaxID=158847 RepID=UPI0025A4A584|nr:ribosome biogenesis GTP-binding protein YihA/YsxC [Megamonas hypermegale]MDM8143890.1 ribosome biogenesis GTP-binding protein YihA/YsxC [Megamonas hypermegale]
MTETKDKINIIRAKYTASAVKKAQYPAERLKEIAFIGRSNVGKSSLINSLTRVHNLARVSGQPGKTQTINFFELTARIIETGEDKLFHLVDLPGYGYAKTAQTNRKQWAKFIEEYFLNSEQLQFVCQLIDIRHAPMKSDIEMFNWLVKNNVPVLIIATKADKISRGAVAKQVAQIRKTLGVKEIDILPYSSVKNAGRSELLEVIYQMLTD